MTRPSVYNMSLRGSASNEAILWHYAIGREIATPSGLAMTYLL